LLLAESKQDGEGLFALSVAAHVAKDGLTGESTEDETTNNEVDLATALEKVCERVDQSDKDHENVMDEDDEFAEENELNKLTTETGEDEDNGIDESLIENPSKDESVTSEDDDNKDSDYSSENTQKESNASSSLKPKGDSSENLSDNESVFSGSSK
jgi:hypothetical protein